MFCCLQQKKISNFLVTPRARRLAQGVGTKLLSWGETIARERGCNKMTLGVINGNAAMRLYKRVGFEVDEKDCCDRCFDCCFVTLFLGRPYGFCHPSWGSSDMTKKVPPIAQPMER